MGVWKELAELGLRGKQSKLELPTGVNWEGLKRTIPGCKVIKKSTGTGVAIHMWAWPRWLMKGGDGCNEMVNNLYTNAGEWSATTMARLGDPEEAVWGETEKIMAGFIKLNGVAKSLWVASDYVIAM